MSGNIRTKPMVTREQRIAQRSVEVRATWDEKERTRRLLLSVVQQNRLYATLFGAGPAD